MAWKTVSLLLAGMMLAGNGNEPLVASSGDAAPMRFHVGDTGIRCVRHPCPSKGVFVPGGGGLDVRKNLVYSDLDGRAGAPPMIGDRAAVEIVTKAWNAMECVAIDGRLISGEDDKPVLRVDRVIGSCRDQAE